MLKKLHLFYRLAAHFLQFTNNPLNKDNFCLKYTMVTLLVLPVWTSLGGH